MGVVQWIVTPLRYAFMVRALIAATMVGGLCAIVGAYVVLRSMAFLGDALAHSVLPGVAIGLLVSGKGDRRALFWWALGTAIAVALAVGWISQRSRLREDTSIGIVFAGMFALGIALISTVKGFAVDLVHFLFGNVLGVSAWDLWLIAAFGGLAPALVILFGLGQPFCLFGVAGGEFPDGLAADDRSAIERPPFLVGLRGQPLLGILLDPLESDGEHPGEILYDMRGNGATVAHAVQPEAAYALAFALLDLAVFSGFFLAETVRHRRVEVASDDELAFQNVHRNLPEHPGEEKRAPHDDRLVPESIGQLDPLGQRQEAVLGRPHEGHRLGNDVILVPPVYDVVRRTCGV